MWIELFKANRVWQRGDEIYRLQTNADCFIFIKLFPRQRLLKCLRSTWSTRTKIYFLSELKIVFTYTLYFFNRKCEEAVVPSTSMQFTTMINHWTNWHCITWFWDCAPILGGRLTYKGERSRLNLSLFICINKTFYKMCNQRFLINIFFDWTMIKKFAVRFIEINIIWIVIHQWIIFTKTNGIRLNCSAVWHNLFLGLIQIVVYLVLYVSLCLRLN